MTGVAKYIAYINIFYIVQLCTIISHNISTSDFMYGHCSGRLHQPHRIRMTKKYCDINRIVIVITNALLEELLYYITLLENDNDLTLDHESY